jgi:beta-lactamase superfamily II metal-dependent hydrolase
MSVIKSFSVGNGDMFYISHNSSNLTIIDCCLTDGNKERIVNEIEQEHKKKQITRFISTHPDEDHVQQLNYLDDRIEILNFYCVDNNASREVGTDGFKKYCELRDSNKVFKIYRGCVKKFMNDPGLTSNGIQVDSAGISILWPIIENEYFMTALKRAEDGGSPNNISPIIKYYLEDGATILWMGDLEDTFMENIIDEISFPKVNILFAPHHGRKSGKVPKKWLDQMDPDIVVLGEAPHGDLGYNSYDAYNKITQNTAEDIIFDCVTSKIHVYTSNKNHTVDFLDNENMNRFNYYIGTLNL